MSNTAALNAIEHHKKSWLLWAFYFLVGILPLAIGSASLILLHFNPEKIAQIEAHLRTLHLPNFITKAVPFFFLFIGIELAVCLITQKKYYRMNDSINSIFMGSFQQIIGVFVKFFYIIPYAYINTYYSVVDYDQEITWKHPIWWGMFVGVEFGYYWLHRFGHEWNAFWAGHVVHHSSEEYNLSTALRQGWFQQMYGWCFYLFAAPFFPIELFSFHNQMNTLYQFWIHTRLINKFPWPIEFIFNTPSHHRVHHGRNPQYIDKNYGGTLIIFDRIFGTFEPEKEEVVYGITHSLNTWNPFYLQNHQWIEMFDTMAKTPGIFNKIRVFLDRGPGYNYEVLHPELLKNPPKVRTEKYDSNPPNLPMSIYAFIHSFGIVATAYWLLKSEETTIIIILSVYNLFGMTSVSALFDRKPWALYTELIRLFLLLAIVSSAIDKRIIADFSAPLMREIIKNPAIMTISNIVVFSAAILLLYYDVSGKEKKE